MRQIDIIALITSVIVAIVMTAFSMRRSPTALRPVAAFFMLLGPATIVVHMIFHIGMINFNAVDSIRKGTFTYDFHYYSLMLMPVAIMYCSWMVLQSSKKFIEGESYLVTLKAMVITVLVTAPIIPLNPIGSLPTLACLITLCALPFVKQQKKRKPVAVKRYPRVVSKPKIETIELLKFV